MHLERFIHRIERTRGILAVAVVLVSLLALAAGLHEGPRGTAHALPTNELAAEWMPTAPEAEEIRRADAPESGGPVPARAEVRLL